MLPQRKMMSPGQIEPALQLVGELLEAGGHRVHIVVIGGAAVNLLGIRSRATTDVDILAEADPVPPDGFRLRPPDQPLPAPLIAAAASVAQDMELDADWLNAGPASQWKTGLPPGMEARVQWRTYGGLSVGVADRRDLVFFKLYAAAGDTGPRSVHFQDLLALSPTDEELEGASVWIGDQDASPDFHRIVREVISHVRALSDRPR